MRKTLTDEVDDLDDRADLVPMIDCVFLMLLFFVVTATFSDQQLFEVDLPTAAQSQTRSTEDAQVIAISADGHFAIGDAMLADDQLLPALRAKLAEKPRTMVVIQGDKGCPYEKVVLAVDAARAVGIPEMCLAVKAQ